MTAKKTHELEKEIGDNLAELERIAETQRQQGSLDVEGTAKFARILVSVARLTDLSTRRIVRLTWALLVLTAALFVVAVAQLR